MRSVAVVLAAGGSSRLGRPKQLLDFRGEPLIVHASKVALGAGCDRTIVVWGSVPPPAALKALDVELLANRGWSEGLASSIRIAVEEAGEARLLLTLVDQPLVTSGHLRNLLGVDAPIVATGYRGTAGVPCVFAPELRNELLALRGDTGARGVIEAHRTDVVTVPFEDAAVDVDSEEDYRRVT